jgi:hypothetical protein
MRIDRWKAADSESVKRRSATSNQNRVREGESMTRLKHCMLLMAAFAGIFSLASRAPAQQFGYPPPGAYPAMQAGYGPGPMDAPGPMGGMPPGGMPPPGMMPGGPGGMPPPDMMGGGGGLPPDYGQGYAEGGGDCYGGDCSGLYGLGHLGCLFHFTDGYKLRPRWYDIQIDYLQLTREEVSRPVNFTSLGVGPAAPIVLSTDNLEFDNRPGMRLTYALLIAPSTNLEATYMGNFFWRSSAAVNGNGNLFSVLSEFGVTPANGFQDTDAADRATIEYSSVLDSTELSVRNRFAEPEGRYHGSWLAGVRYIRLDEQFRHFTITPLGSMDYQVRTFNDLVGFQFGGDLCLRPTPRFLIGMEGKAGIYGNPGEQQTTVTATTLATPLEEREISTQVSFVGEADFFAVYHYNERFSIRGGYQLLYLTGVALGPENFNTEPPFVAPRTTFVDVTGEVFYHGFHVGFEWVW